MEQQEPENSAIKDSLPSIHITKDTPQEYVEKIAKECDRCGHCCSYGSGIFLEQDIARVADFLGIREEELINDFLEEQVHFNKKIYRAKLRKQKGRPYGSCYFFDKKHGCMIHEKKPLHCRLTKGCGEYGQELGIWFLLNYIIDAADPQSLRDYAAYLKTHPTIPGGELHNLIKDKELLNKILSHEILVPDDLKKQKVV